MLEPVRPVFSSDLSWSSVLGLFVLNFGALDHLIFVYLRAAQSPDEFETTGKKGFGDRIKLVRLGLESGESVDVQEIGELFRRLEAVRRLRNHVAHAVLVGRADPVRATLVMPKDLDAYSDQSSNRLTFDELLAASEELSGVIEEFRKILSNSGSEPNGRSEVAG